jgi:hypothetical protein
MDLTKIKVGDLIKFCSPTRNGTRTVWRVVNGHWCDTNMPTVRYMGWANFAVRLREIIEVEVQDA